MWLCKRDLSKKCEGKYRDCTDCVLDKIRTEIESLLIAFMRAGEIQKGALKILDKYKAESEDKE